MIYIMGTLLEKSHLSKVLGPLEFRVLLTSPAAYMILSLAEKASFFSKIFKSKYSFVPQDFCMELCFFF